MKKVIRLTESDLTRLVKRVMNEMLDSHVPRKSKGILGQDGHGWFDQLDRPIKNQDEFDYDEEYEFGPDDFEDYLDKTSDVDNKWSFQTKGWDGSDKPGRDYFDAYTKHGKKLKLRKKRDIDEMEDDDDFSSYLLNDYISAMNDVVDDLPENCDEDEIQQCIIDLSHIMQSAEDDEELSSEDLEELDKYYEALVDELNWKN
jgi:hypothetical protein